MIIMHQRLLDHLKELQLLKLFIVHLRDHELLTFYLGKSFVPHLNILHLANHPSAQARNKFRAKFSL